MRKSLILAAAALIGLSTAASAEVVTTYTLPANATPAPTLTEGSKYLIYDASKLPSNGDAVRRAFRYAEGTYIKGVNNRTPADGGVFDTSFAFIVGGNNTDGYTFKNVATDKYINVAANGTVTANETASTFKIVTTHTDGFSHYVKSTEYDKVWDGNEALNMVTWGYSADQAGLNGENAHWYQFFEITDAMTKVEETTTNTFNFYDSEGNLVDTKTVEGYVGQPYTFTINGMLSPKSYSGTLSSEPTHNYTVTVSIPFQVSENTDNMIWQAVYQHWEQQQHYFHWKYTADDQANPLGYGNDVAETLKFTDNELWAFTGDFANGFTIYNKAAGTSKVLMRKNGSIVVGAPSDNKADYTWYLRPSSLGDAPNTTHTCFKLIDSNYLNVSRNANNIPASTFIFHGDADGGSTCWFYTVTDPAVNAASGIAELGVFNPNTVGVPSIEGDINALVTAVANAQADENNEELIQPIKDALSNITLGEKLEFDSSKYYRLRNNHFHTYMAAGTDLNVYGGETDINRAETIFKFTDTTQDRYNMSCQGMYIQGKKANNGGITQVENQSAAHNFGFVHTDKGLYNVSSLRPYDNGFGEGAYLHHQTTGNIIVGWYKNATDYQSFWNLEVAESLDVTLTHSAGDYSYAPVCFDFPVKAGNDGSELLIVLDGYRTGDKEDRVVTWKKVNVLPAGMAGLVRREEGTTATLVIDYDNVKYDSEDYKNVLGGVFRAGTVADGNFAFGVQNGELGFFKISAATPAAYDAEPSAPTAAIPANGIYLDASQVNEKSAAKDALLFEAPGNTTEIAEIEVATPANGAIFDLQGRRVANPSKGLYIINGKKTLIR